MGTASSPSVDLLTNHGCCSDFPTPDGAVSGTVQCRWQLLAVQGNHTIADPHCFGLSKDVISCTVI